MKKKLENTTYSTKNGLNKRRTSSIRYIHILELLLYCWIILGTAAAAPTVATETQGSLQTHRSPCHQNWAQPITQKTKKNKIKNDKDSLESVHNWSPNELGIQNRSRGVKRRQPIWMVFIISGQNQERWVCWEGVYKEEGNDDEKWMGPNLTEGAKMADKKG